MIENLYIKFLSLSLITYFFYKVLNLISKKFDFLREAPSKEIRKIHSKKMIKIGGICITSIYFIYFFYQIPFQINMILLYAIPFLIVGLISDTNLKFNYIFRLGIFFIVLLIYFIQSKNTIIISPENFLFFEKLFFENEFLIFLFPILCTIFFINAANIIDGLHGLKLGSIILILILFSIKITNKESILYEFHLLFIFILFTLFLLNFFTGEIRSGDTGSYFCGFIVATLAISLNRENYISSFHILVIIFYPTIEMVFSFTRRLFSKKNPFKPDQEHLHHLVYKYLEVKLKSKKFLKNYVNQVSSIIILISQSFILFGTLNFESNFSYFITYLILIILYSLIYYFLKKKSLIKNYYSK